MSKARLVELHERISESRKTEARKTRTRKKAALDAVPPRGSRDNFYKITVTVPPDVYEATMAEVVRRKLAKEPNRDLSGVVREALVAFLEGGGGQEP